ncbi:MAG: nucleotidyltransferase domain-containing protein [Saprospiraceae bacterium]
MNNPIFLKIKNLVMEQEPHASVILFGSNARGDNSSDSDIDILILVDKERLSQADEKRVKYPLYDLEFESGQIISPIVFSRKDWESRHSVTPLYANIKREGISL